VQRSASPRIISGWGLDLWGATCFSDCSAFTMDMFIRLSKVRLTYATKLNSTWKFGSCSVASPARPLNLHGDFPGPLRRNQRGAPHSALGTRSPAVFDTE
jgi:hypothetical protein